MRITQLRLDAMKVIKATHDHSDDRPHRLVNEMQKRTGLPPRVILEKIDQLARGYM